MERKTNLITVSLLAKYHPSPRGLRALRMREYQWSLARQPTSAQRWPLSANSERGTRLANSARGGALFFRSVVRSVALERHNGMCRYNSRKCLITRTVE